MSGYEIVDKVMSDRGMDGSRLEIMVNVMERVGEVSELEVENELKEIEDYGWNLNWEMV
jgi:hypothetical protein